MAEGINSIGGNQGIKPDWDILNEKKEEPQKGGYANFLMNNIGNMLNGSLQAPSDAATTFQG